MMNIFDIERYATKDGPGIRTVLFFKGCNLRCAWCQNPESQAAGSQVMFYGNKCAACGKCIEVCPDEAITVTDLGYITDHLKCSRCGKCTDACFYSARKMIGKEYSPDEVMNKILADRDFYAESGGGVTFSGGEPLLYPADIRSIAQKCREQGIHTAVETAGSVPWRVFEDLLPLIDLFFIDLKHIDTEKHKKYTGMGNTLILENIIRLSRSHQRVVLRIPVVPGVNHDIETMSRMLDFTVRKTSIREVELLPYHRLGAGKYDGLGMIYPAAEMKNVGDEECIGYEEYGKGLGLSVRTGAI